MLRKITESLSFKSILVAGEAQSVAIVDTTEFDTKKIFSMPGESLQHGAIIDWADSKWLLTEINAHAEYCVEGRIRRCNHLLRWIDESGVLVERWCVVEDGTKYLVGESENDLMAVGDARIAVTIGKDEATSKLSRGRRFLIDDEDACDILAYEITKSNKLFNVYHGVGVFRFILSEVNVTDNDNLSLRIADYYNWSPSDAGVIPDIQDGKELDEIVSGAVSEDTKRQQLVSESGVWI